MPEYTGLPLNTPTVVEDNAQYQRIATRTQNGGTVQTVPKAGSVGANQADLYAKLSTLLTEAAQAQTLLQAQRDQTNLAAGTLTTAQLSTAARQLQAAVKEQAMLQQQHMKRTVAIARLMLGALEATSDT